MRNSPLLKISTFSQNNHISQNKHTIFGHMKMCLLWVGTVFHILIRTKIDDKVVYYNLIWLVILVHLCSEIYIYEFSPVDWELISLESCFVATKWKKIIFGFIDSSIFRLEWTGPEQVQLNTKHKYFLHFEFLYL